MANVAAKQNGMLLPQDLRTVTIDGPPSQYMRINVGGYFFSTTIGTLTSRDTMLRAMFSGKMEVLTDAEGWILIDRCGTHFGRILNWLRDGQVPLPSSQVELEELALEAKYYLCEELLHLCEAKLNASRATGSEPEAACQVPYVTSPLEEQMLLLTTKRPVVKLQINRHNNKYSYTSASEENLLKSLELFDKMALKFCKRILFIKDVVSTNEICCWAFYGNSKKLAEVCCTSIVYTSDKGKHTKVEFPESRILEETLNVLLYERPFAQMFQPPAGSFSPADAATPTANAATVDAGSSVNNFGSNNNNAAGRVRHVHHPLRQTSSEQQPDVVGAVATHHPQSNANASRSHGSCSSAHLVTASSSTRATSSQQQVVRLSQSASGENNEAAHVGRSSSHSLTRSSNPTSSGSSTN